LELRKDEEDEEAEEADEAEEYIITQAFPAISA
jgi:hypothetical protein